jgi:hypothetical protein
MPEQSHKPVVLPDSGSPEPATTEAPERRRTTRYSFIATADAYELRSQTRVTGRCSDLSVGGCYLDTLAPFSVGAQLRIEIHHDSREFQAKGVVAYAHTSLGMGIMFTEIKDESREILRYWIADLSGEPLAPPEPVKAPAAASVSSFDSQSNMRLVLNELITLLVRKKLITEMEGAELLFRALR